MSKMKAAIFVEPGRIVLGERPIPEADPLDALRRSTTTSLCPGGKERMRRLVAVVESGRIDLAGLVTHHFKLDDIEQAYELFAHQRDNVLKVAITP